MLHLARSRPVRLGLVAGMLLIYDGECGFCRRWAQWARARLPSHVRIEPWQALELKALELTRQEVETAVCWLEDDRVRGSTRCQGAEAIGRALLTANGAYKVMGRLILRPPMCWMARPVYAIVAANRHHLSKLWSLRPTDR